ncbi:phosphonate C-P lyase system protein PhnL [Hypericibacter adhaerens]|jgi:alpha-D-ribose 1-methylphosphonate 5-triphosphate synthase subunit PhnL|uniref:Phosphonate C-P lyase system protein PhnL n=2 Tax=Hypericibacter adhaerens TaxID=2602016 RepID=A0A5J6MXU8_9PROT|nr:phosphonate C-P lyase system protein PhnL [Hypericibacter adhaerens]
MTRGGAMPMIETRGLAKNFTLHVQGEVKLAVLSDIDLSVAAGECVVLDGPSGAGKSTLMRTLYGNYRADAGAILVRHGDERVDLATASPRLALELRRRTLGYISQFLRVIPRVPTLEVVAEPLRARGVGPQEARERAGALLERLALPRRLWPLSPVTFSGGEQQRVNIARGLLAGHPILLVDEPTASLDAVNRSTVVSLLREARAAGTAIVAICHDPEARDALATRYYNLPPRELAA